MITTYTYTTADFPQGLEIERLKHDIRQSAITTSLHDVWGQASTLYIVFKAALSAEDKERLDGGATQTPEQPPLAGSVLANHSGQPLFPVEQVEIANKRLVIGKGTNERIVQVSQNFCDPCTWVHGSVRVSDATAVFCEEATNPPASPQEEEAFWVGVGAGGAWSGKDGQLAIFRDGGWLFVLPPAWYGGLSAAYKLPAHCLIDTAHGKLTDEDSLLHPDGGSLRLIVQKDGIPLVEDDPHEAEEHGGSDPVGEFEANYRQGILFLKAAPSPTEAITASFCKSQKSEFTVRPPVGKRLLLSQAEVQFSTDVVLRDTVRFQAWGNISKQPTLAPLVGLPCGVVAGFLSLIPWKDPAETVVANEKIPLQRPKTWKTMKDYIDEASFAYPKYPALGGSGWRGLVCDVVIFHWEYLQEIPLSSAQETEIRISLAHDRPFFGTFATATFYSIAEVE